MILDTVKNGEKYASVHPLFKKAFTYLQSVDLAALPVSQIELQGSDLVVNVVDITGKKPEDARMETHNNFIDIQVPVGAAETMGWIAGEKLVHVTHPYNADKDITFLLIKPLTLFRFNLTNLQFSFPKIGHQPGIAKEHTEK